MALWAAEIEVDEQLAAELIGDQFPELDTTRLRRIGEGWDYTIWATGDDVAFRFPRREMVVAGMAREMALLPELSGQLPAPIPDARHQGTPSSAFAWPFFGSALIAGRELTAAGLDEEARDQLADDLGAFVRTLHGLPTPEQLRGVVDPNRRADMPFRVARAREMIGVVSVHWARAPHAEPILTAAERLEPDRRLVLSHGDLHLRQILVTDPGRLAGVVDWVDVCVAPRSVDLAALWSLFTPSARERFLAAYGAVDAATLLRARALALCLSAMLAAYAIDRGDEILLAEALAELDRALID